MLDLWRIVEVITFNVTHLTVKETDAQEDISVSKDNIKHFNPVFVKVICAPDWFSLLGNMLFWSRTRILFIHNYTKQNEWMNDRKTQKSNFSFMLETLNTI